VVSNLVKYSLNPKEEMTVVLMHVCVLSLSCFHLRQLMIRGAVI